MIDVFKAKRREPRVRLNTRVVVTGRDVRGEIFSAETTTVDVSPRGASLPNILVLNRVAADRQLLDARLQLQHARGRALGRDRPRRRRRARRHRVPRRIPQPRRHLVAINDLRNRAR